MSFNNIKHIFFDLDHTLWDFEKNSEEAMNEIITKCQKDCEFNFTIKEFMYIYKPINELMWKLYRENKISKEKMRIRRFSDALIFFGIIDIKLAEYMADEYIKISPQKTNLFPHTIDTLKYLSKKYKLHIITNGFNEVQFTKIKLSNIEIYFDKIITSEDIGVKKPDPIIFSYSLEKANAKAHESIMIGDNYEVDIMGAINSNIKAIYFNMAKKRDLHKHASQITNLQELMVLL